MRNNQPVTQREYLIDDGTTLMSSTDLQSHLTYANAAFIQVSGYDKDELLGQPHNLVRHPDMPPQAFADMWSTLQAGQSWTALVKNRRKNGDHYWVRANATPVKRKGAVVGYMSVRTKPGRDEVAAAEALYRGLREGRSGVRAFHKGLVVRTGWLGWTSALQVLPVRWRVRIGVLGLALGGAAPAWVVGGAAALPVSATLGVLAVLATTWIEHQVARPLARVLDHALAVAAGQADAMPPLDRVDEIGMLARAIGQAGLNLRSLLDDVSGQVDGVGTAASEIAQGNSDLSGRTEQAAASLQQTAASMAQMASTVANNAQSTREAESLARQACATANAGTADVERVIVTMDQIQASSKKIADIIGVIDGIAFQTNILALNAAVEAARAGEQGRGFAVVAAEVRSLAQRSAKAAKDIKDLIQQSVAGVDSGAALVRKAGTTMGEIVQRVDQVSGLIDAIANATTEQSQGISQVDAAVNQLDQMTQQNAALVEQSAAAAMSLQQQSGSLAESVRAFRSAAA